MTDCKFCKLLASGDVSDRLPNLILETAASIAALNRRPAAPGHVTVILKSHLGDSDEFTDDAFRGMGAALGKLATALKARYRPLRVVLLGDGKSTAHPHLHLIPEPEGIKLDLGAVVADLNQINRADTMSPEQVCSEAAELRAALAPAFEDRP